MRRVGLLVAVTLLLWACTGGAVSTTTTVVPATSPPSSTATTTSSTTTSTAPDWPEILVTNDDGVFYVDSAGEVSQLVKGRVAYAVDDTRGGLLFQVERGRSPGWSDYQEPVKSTEVWWVPQGAGEAQAVLVPTPDSRLDLSLVDAVEVEGRTLVMYERHDSTMDPEYGPHGWYDTLRAFDLDSHQVTELTTFPGWEHSTDFSTGGGLTVVDEESIGGTCCYFLDIALSDEASVPVVPQLEGCWELDDHCSWRCVLSTDGTALAYVDGDNASVEDQVVKVVDISSGEVTVEVPGTASSLDLGDGYLIVNKEVGRSLMVSLSDPAQRHEVSVSGTARIITAPIDIAAPVIPPTPAAIQLRADGLGVVDFGDPVEEAVARLVRVLGPPDDDRTVTSADLPEGVGIGTALGYPGWRFARLMSWETPQLLVMFSDRDLSGADLEPVPPFFNGWVYSGPGEGQIVALEPPEGITVGSSIAELRTAYGPDLWLPTEPEVCGGNWIWNAAPSIPSTWSPDETFKLRGQLDRNPSTPGAIVTQISAGYGFDDC